MNDRFFKDVLDSVKSCIDDTTIVSKPSKHITIRKHTKIDSIVSFVLFDSRLLIECYTSNCTPIHKKLHTDISVDQTEILNQLIKGF